MVKTAIKYAMCKMPSVKYLLYFSLLGNINPKCYHTEIRIYSFYFKFVEANLIKIFKCILNANLSKVILPCFPDKYKKMS